MTLTKFEERPRRQQPAPVPLPAQFRREGFDFCLIERRGSVALYVQTRRNLPHFRSWVVAMIRTRKEGNVFGRPYPAMEVFPADSAWGRLAWSCATEERARERMAALLSRQATKARHVNESCAWAGRS